MGKAKRATRKELETVVGKLIQELQLLQFEMRTYIKYKGDTLEYNDFIKKEFNKIQRNAERLVTPELKEREKIDKKSRYKKVSTPPL